MTRLSAPRLGPARVDSTEPVDPARRALGMGHAAAAREMRLLLLSFSFSCSFLAACGSEPSADSAGAPGWNGTGPETELFVRRSAAGLEIVEVDLANGAATSVAGVIPDTTSSDAKVRNVVRAGDRMLVSTSISSAAPADWTYATYVLDRPTKTWRDLHVASYNPSYTRDLGIVVEGRTSQDPQAPNNVKLVG